MDTKEEKAKRKKRAKLWGNLLVGFVNNDSHEGAYIEIKNKINSNLKKYKIEVEDKQMNKDMLRVIEGNRDDLKELFEQLLKKDIKLEDIKSLEGFIDCYQFLSKPPEIYFDDNGSLEVMNEIDSLYSCDDLIARGVVTFLEYEGSRDLLFKCDQCQKYQIADREKRKKWCSRTCKNKYNREKVN